MFLTHLNEQNCYNVVYNDYYLKFMKAIGSVGWKYCEWPYDNINNNVQRIERVFCYELYYKYRVILDTNNPLELIFNGEISKQPIDKELRMENPIFSNINFDFNRISPDFVLHDKQNNHIHQVFATEIKVYNNNDYNNILRDIKKCCYYVKQIPTMLEFDCAFLISIGEGDLILNTVRQIFTEFNNNDAVETNDLFKKIIFVQKKEKELKYSFLNKILNPLALHNF